MNDSLTRFLSDPYIKFIAELLSEQLLYTAPVVLMVYVTIRRLMIRYIEGHEKSRYDDIKKEAVLSEIRASYEHRIADLNREMVATRVRWEEANHLLISGQGNQPSEDSNRAVDVNSFLKSYGIDPDSIQIDSNRIFVLTPFSETERAVFEEIKSICSESGFSVIRGDEDRADGSILSQIIVGIVSSKFIIANISSRNPNVFFELGIAMALGKSTLLLSDTLSDVPFDVKSRRIIVFQKLSELKPKLTTALLQTIRSMVT